MRRLLRFLSVLGVVIAAVAVLLGWLLARPDGSPIGAPAQVRQDGWMLHGMVGGASAIVASITAAIAFLLGLHGLLAGEERRMRTGLLFCLAPVLMGLGLWAAISGWRSAAFHRLPMRAPEALIAQHRAPGLGLLCASLAALGGAFLLVRSGEGDGSQERD